MSNHALIDIKDLVKNYTLNGKQSTVLQHVALQVAAGDLLAIVGASGSGKSTLMNIIGLLDTADAGTYLLNNHNVANLNADEAALLRNQHIGFVFQQFNLLPRFTALHNVALPLTYRSLTATQVQAQVMEALQQVNMQDYAHHKPMQLSGGQQQRIAIARALVTNPQVILADEPTGALDSHTGADVMQLFLQLHAAGRTVILVTHDHRIASQCQRRITIADGAIVPELSP